MRLNLNIPKHTEDTLRELWGDAIDAVAFEALVIEACRTGLISAAKAGELMGFESRWDAERWLADKKVPLDYTLADFDADCAALDRVLGKSKPAC